MGEFLLGMLTGGAVCLIALCAVMVGGGGR